MEIYIVEPSFYPADGAKIDLLACRSYRSCRLPLPRMGDAGGNCRRSGRGTPPTRGSQSPFSWATFIIKVEWRESLGGRPLEN